MSQRGKREGGANNGRETRERKGGIQGRQGRKKGGKLSRISHSMGSLIRRANLCRIRGNLSGISYIMGSVIRRANLCRIEVQYPY